MNFDFSEEQLMLRDSVARFVQDDYDFDTRRRIADSEEGISRDNWSTFAELGWLSVPFAEEHGGFGGGPVDLTVVMEEFGKGLVLEPFLPTVVMFGGLLRHAGNEAQQAQYIPRIIEGSCLGAVAYLERQSRYELSDVATTATPDGDGFVLSGEKVAVQGGAHADTFIVVARTAGEQCDATGLSLFLLPADAPGLERISYRMMDGQRVANLRLDNVRVEGSALLGAQDQALPLLEALALETSVAVGAEALGIMGTLNRKTLDYTKTREQFGVPIGSFQVLQHRMVDTFMSYEQAKSLLYRAVCALEKADEDPALDVHAMRALLDKAGRHIYAEAIQLHGGMGLTDELDIGHYAKRLMQLNTVFGDGDYHQARFSALRYG